MHIQEIALIALFYSSFPTFYRLEVFGNAGPAHIHSFPPPIRSLPRSRNLAFLYTLSILLKGIYTFSLSTSFKSEYQFPPRGPVATTNRTARQSIQSFHHLKDLLQSLQVYFSNQQNQNEDLCHLRCLALRSIGRCCPCQQARYRVGY